MKKNNKLSKYLDIIICILFVFIFSIFLNTKHYDNDLFFDLKTGETILKYGIDFKDHFSFIPNLIYLYHHWLYDLIIFSIKNCFGFLGIKIFFLMVFFIFNLLYFFVCNKIIKNKMISLLITFFVSYYASIFFTTRVQSLTYILFFLEILLLNKLYNSNKKHCLIYLFLLCTLIVNLHMPLWIFSLVLFLPYLCSALLSIVCNNKKIGKNIIIEKPANYKYIWLSLLIIIVSPLISPFGLKTYAFLFKYIGANGYSYLDISELQATSLIYYKYVLVIILLLIIGLYLKVLKICIKDLFLILGLFVFSLLSLRNVIYILIIGSYVLIKSFSFRKVNIKRKIVINKNLVEIITIPFLVVITIYALAIIDYSNNSYDLYEDYPVEMVEYIKNNLDVDNMKLYNHFNFGSYIEYQDVPVFIDSRAEVYIKEFNGGNNIAKDYYDSTKIDSYEKVFKKYKFNYALIYKRSDLEYFYKYNDYFKIIKSDDNFILYNIDEKLYIE